MVISTNLYEIDVMESEFILLYIAMIKVLT